MMSLYQSKLTVYSVMSIGSLRGTKQRSNLSVTGHKCEIASLCEESAGLLRNLHVRSSQ